MYTCDVCNGVREFHGFVCRDCEGTGKVDWIRRVKIKSDNNDVFLWACINGNFNRVKRLVKQGIDIHIHNDLALSWSAENGHLNIVKFLTEQGGTDINRPVYSSALCWAGVNKHLDVIKFLRERLSMEIIK
jgi:ankyrin repeat protein